MTEPVFYPDGPAAARVEITNGQQIGPARLTGQFGVQLDHTNAGRMTLWVDVVDVEGNRLTLYDDTSYENAIIEAEEAARDWGVAVDDAVGP
jgi:hypothetical protein